MANKFLDITGLTKYDGKTKEYIDGKDAAERSYVDNIKDSLTSSINSKAAQADLTAEVNRATGAEEALDVRLDKVETFFQTAEGETINEALDTLVEIQKYITQDGAAANEMVQNIANNKAAIDAIKKDYLKAADKTELSNAIDAVEERMTTAEGEIDALQTKVNGNGEGSVAKMIESAVAAEAELRATGVTEAKNAAKAADDKAVAAQNTANANTTEIAKKANQTDLEALQGRVNTVENDLNTASTGIKAKLTAVEEKANNNATNISANASDIAELLSALEWKTA